MLSMDTQNLNSDIAMNFRKNLVEGKIDFLVNFETAKDGKFFLTEQRVQTGY